MGVPERRKGLLVIAMAYGASTPISPKHTNAPWPKEATLVKHARGYHRHQPKRLISGKAYASDEVERRAGRERH